MARAPARAAALLASLLTLCSAARGAAEADGPGDPAAIAEAERLFTDGTAALAREDYATACPLLEQSYQLDPATGALLALGQCHERSGALAAAHRDYVLAASRSEAEQRPVRVRAARKRAAALAAQLPSLTVRWGDATPGLVVSVDGAQLSPRHRDRPLVLDAGPHRLIASAPDHTPYETTVTLSDPAAGVQVRVPPLRRRSAAAANPPAVANAPDRGPAPDSAPPQRRDAAPRTARWVGLSLVGAGLVAAGVGAVMAVTDAGKSSAPQCSAGLCEASGTQHADIAGMALAAGGVLVATGALLYFSFERDRAPQGGAGGLSGRTRTGPLHAGVWLQPSGAGANVAGHF